MLSAVAAHRRFLHQIPELGDQLPQTLMLVEGVLRGHRCEHTSPIPGSVCAWFDFGREETVAVRAAMDALPVREITGLPYSSRHPGQMHAAGHDGLTAMLLSLCQWLAGRPEGIPRNVLAIFQPSSGEDGDGADRLCGTGILEQYRVSRIFGADLWPGIPAGTVASRPGAFLARSNEVTVRAYGKSVHVSRAGEGRDAMLAAAEYLRRTYEMADAAPPPTLLRFGTFSAGPGRDRISGEAVLEGVLRTYQENVYESCREALSRIARDVGEETGCQFDVRVSGSRPAVWNDEALYAEICEGLGPDAPLLLDAPSLASGDFAYYQQYVPGVSFFLGVGETYPLGSPQFDFDDEGILPRGVDLLKALVQLP